MQQDRIVDDEEEGRVSSPQHSGRTMQPQDPPPRSPNAASESTARPSPPSPGHHETRDSSSYHHSHQDQDQDTIRPSASQDSSSHSAGSSNVVNFYRKRFESKNTTRRQQLEQLRPGTATSSTKITTGINNNSNASSSSPKKSPYSTTSSVTYDGGGDDDYQYLQRFRSTHHNHAASSNKSATAVPMFPAESLSEQYHPDQSAAVTSHQSSSSSALNEESSFKSQSPPRLTPKLKRRSDTNHFPTDFLPPQHQDNNTAFRKDRLKESSPDSNDHHDDSSPTAMRSTPSTETAVTTATTTAASSTYMPRLVEGTCATSTRSNSTSSKEPRKSPGKEQDQEGKDLQYLYYRIVYRGVVALLTEPDTSSARSGAYVSYGEIVQTRQQLPYDSSSFSSNNAVGTGTENMPGASVNNSASSPSKRSTNRLGSAVRSPVLQDAWQGTASTLETLEISASSPHIIRVDNVLTGGYAVDAMNDDYDVSSSRRIKGTSVSKRHLTAVEERVLAHEKTPKRNNTQPVPVVGPSPLPIHNGHAAPAVSNSSDGDEIIDADSAAAVHGYLFTHRNQVAIAEPLLKPPICETGSYVYKVVSSTPLPILTGPCADAPTTKAMLLPGTVHEVCLKLVDGDVTYLRLSRKRGWVADRKTSVGSKVSNIPTMKEVSADTGGNISMHDDCNISILSMTSSSVATPISTAHRRHRPPRRRRKADHSFSLPKQVTDTSMSFDNSFVNSSMEKGVMSPSSNVSLLSDESSLENANSSILRPSNPPTPDRSVARSTASSSVHTQLSTFYLMRVNAPRGLKILDAPHFQVNNLIHGQDPSHHQVKSPPKGSAAGTNNSNNKSIFQTMGAHHTTTYSSKISNPAIFDSITKARKLPRGCVFEASQRMEGPGAYSKSAGLIKLSDNSGWAIVPRQDELDEQYRNYHGSLTGVKEGEATRAFEEVGNAIADDRKAPIYLRVISRGGVGVSLPPQSSSISDTSTSPTSSAAGGSSSGSGHLRSQDSDVASSVGSSFLDAMFRTPKKKGVLDQQSATETANNVTKILPQAVERQPPTLSTVIQCGVCLEVEPWSDSPEIADQNPHRHEYVRLRGGQGWIPKRMNGKPIVDRIVQPEFRFGSFWFRVQAKDGIKVRLGPSRRAPSIKSDDGVYFRFECGEFLRASEVMTIFHKDQPVECFAKLYRNRHVQLYSGHGEVRQLASLTAQAEWVQIFDQHDLFLEECGTEPRIERHKQGWRYNVVLDARVVVRKGPSYGADTTNVTLLGGESVLVNERVTSPGESFSWLRLKDGQGWVQNIGSNGETLMIPHSLRHRATPGGKDDIAYNTVIARLFHGEIPEEKSRPTTTKFGRP